MAERTPIDRRAVLRAAAATAATTAGISLVGPGSAADAATPTVGDTSHVYYPEQFGFLPATRDHTKSMAAFFAAIQRTGGTGILPPTEIRVTSTGLDYSTTATARQPASGAPYGFPEVRIIGYGRGVTTIRQIAGSTGDVFTVQGKTGSNAGPGANNKAIVSLSNLSISGTSTGRHGLYLRSLLHSRFTDLEIDNCGKAGVFCARETFTATNDEYSYANVVDGLRIISAGTWGFDCDGLNAIDIVMRDTEIINCGSGGIRIAPTNANFENIRIIGCGVGQKAARGFLAIPSANLASVASELNVSGIRLEGNSGPGGYQAEISGGVGATISGFNIITSSDKGAHGIGVGVTTTGGSKAVSRAMIGRGSMFLLTTNTTQKAIVLGPDARDTRIEMPALPSNPTAAVADVVTNSGQRNVDQYGKPLTVVQWAG